MMDLFIQDLRMVQREVRKNMKNSIITVLIVLVLLSGCGVENKTNSTIESGNENGNRQNDSFKTNKVEGDDLLEEDLTEDDFGSNTFWIKELKKNEKEIENLINWTKKVDFCEAISVKEDGSLDTLPNNKKTKDKIKKTSGFDDIKKTMKKYGYDIRNEWKKKKTIEILSKFEKKEVRGNYCLVYCDKKAVKDNYKHIKTDYYTEVIFYE